MPRPWVAISRSWSRGWMARSRTATFGRLPVNWPHCLPPSTETKRPNSVPRNRRSRVDEVLLDHVGVALDVGGRERLPGLAEVGGPEDVGLHVARSCGRRRWRRPSPRRSGRPRPTRPRRSSAGPARSRPRSSRSCRRRGSPARCRRRCRPRSRRGSSATREIAKIVQWFSAVELSRVSPPDSSCFCFAGSLVVRSGEIRSQRVAAVAGAEQELRAVVDRALVARAQVDRGVPVEAVLGLARLRAWA